MPAARIGHAHRDGGSPCPDNHFLPCNYRQRAAPEYFADDAEDGVEWQPDVYPYAAEIVHRFGRHAVIDLGCGRAGKLVKLAGTHPGWDFVGVDVGPNIAWCRTALQFGEWIEADLETCPRLPLDTALVRQSVVVCSDVLEHLVHPETLTDLIVSLLSSGAARAVLSTPARELRAGPAALGPPRNRCHVREWASHEFCAFLRAREIEIEDFVLTRSDDAVGGRTTQLVMARADRAPVRL